MNPASQLNFKGKLLLDEPMSKHTSWRLGGPADEYYIPADLADLQNYLAAQDDKIDIFWVGLGSNLLVRDGGIRGIVIAPLNALKEIQVLDDGRVYVQCGVTCAKLAKFCNKNNLDGGDFYAGIPGTVGGALAMNAGAFGGETWNAVEELIMLDRQGELTSLAATEFEVGYRTVKIPNKQWFAAAIFNFPVRQENDVSDIRQLLKQRNESQPIGLASCGSVFTNPTDNHAAALIEKSGLKGHCLKTACVSEKHANFIISTDDTSAADVEALIKFIQQTVEQKHGIKLQTEVRIVGEA